MTKQIFTKTQAVSVLVQVQKTTNINIFLPVDKSHNLFKLSCDELEKKLRQHIDSDNIAGVVDEV